LYKQLSIATAKMKQNRL